MTPAEVIRQRYAEALAKAWPDLADDLVYVDQVAAVVLAVRDEELAELREQVAFEQHRAATFLADWQFLDMQFKGQARGQAIAHDVQDAVMAGLRDQLARQAESMRSYQAADARVRELHEEHEGRCMRCLESCTCLDDAEQTPEGLWNAWSEVCGHGNALWPCPSVAALDNTLKENGHA